MSKKIISVFVLFAVLSSFILSGCTVKPYENTSEEDLFADDPDELSEEELSSISYFKKFTGGTGYMKDSEGHGYYEYSGGKMQIEMTVMNSKIPFECGFFVALNGVFQDFILKTPRDGKVSDMGIMHAAEIHKSENLEVILEFTPSVGKTGDILNIGVGTMQKPSFSNEYSGWPRYSKFGYHFFSAASLMTLHMKADSPVKSGPADVKIENTEIPELYKDIVCGHIEPMEQQKEWDNSSLNYLMYEKFDNEKDVINVPDEDSVTLYIDGFGKKSDRRVSVFINNEILKFGDSSYIDLHVENDKVSRAFLPVKLSGLNKNSHIYAIWFEKSEDGTYIYQDKTATNFFIIGSMPEITSAAEETTLPKESIPSGENFLDNSRLIYAGRLNDESLCFITKDSELIRHAYFYNEKEDAFISDITLSDKADVFKISDGKLYVIENIKTIDGKIYIFDSTGKNLSSIPYTDNKSVPFDGGGAFGLLFGALKRLTVNSEKPEMLYIAGSPEVKKTYIVDLNTSDKKVVSGLSGDSIPSSINNFSSDNYLIMKTTDNESVVTLSDINGNIIKTLNFTIPKNETSAGPYTVIYDRKANPGVKTSGKAVVINCIDGETKEIDFEDYVESQWVTVSSDGRFILTFDSDSVLKLYDLSDGKLIKAFSVSDIDPSINTDNVFIDSSARKIYVTTFTDDSYGCRILNF